MFFFQAISLQAQIIFNQDSCQLTFHVIEILITDAHCELDVHLMVRKSFYHCRCIFNIDFLIQWDISKRKNGLISRSPPGKMCQNFSFLKKINPKIKTNEDHLVMTKVWCSGIKSHALDIQRRWLHWGGGVVGEAQFCLTMKNWIWLGKF